MVDHDSHAHQRAKKRARKEELAVQHEAAEGSDGAAASTSQAVEQLAIGVQEINLNEIIDKSSLAAKVTEQDMVLQKQEVTLQKQDAVLDKQEAIILQQARGLRGFQKKLDDVNEDVRTARDIATTTQDQIGRYLRPFENHQQRLNFIEAKQQASGPAIYQAVHGIGELRAEVQAVCAEVAAIKEEAVTQAELAATNMELVEFRVQFNRDNERLGLLEELDKIKERLDRLEGMEIDGVDQHLNRLEVVEINNIKERIARLEAAMLSKKENA